MADTEGKVKQHEKNVMDFKHTIFEFTNPFAEECGQLINMVTKVVMPDGIPEDVNKRTEIGEEKFV